MKLEAQHATIKTASVEIRSLIVSGKQVTLSVFRQLREQLLFDEQLNLMGVPWGVVNYYWGDMNKDEVHVVAQFGMELVRCLVNTRLDRDEEIHRLKSKITQLEIKLQDCIDKSFYCEITHRRETNDEIEKAICILEARITQTMKSEAERYLWEQSTQEYKNAHKYSSSVEIPNYVPDAIELDARLQRAKTEMLDKILREEIYYTPLERLEIGGLICTNKKINRITKREAKQKCKDILWDELDQTIRKLWEEHQKALIDSENRKSLFIKRVAEIEALPQLFIAV